MGSPFLADDNVFTHLEVSINSGETLLRETVL